MEEQLLNDKARYVKETAVINNAMVKEENALFDRWCPGLSEELAGFAKALNVKLEYLYFYSMTYLVPCCSQIALLSSTTKDKKPLLARNYEFYDELEDFCLMKTKINGKYTHMATSMLAFGRDDGFNEHGLVITITSCGMPIVNMAHMKKPKVKGLQYWVVIRALLENCKDVKEALHYLEGMPIAFNMNMMLMDKEQHVALVQTIDGILAIKEIDSTSKETILYTTNHSILEELSSLEPQALCHSIQRYQYINKKLEGKNTISCNTLKNMLVSKYPNGLCFHYYKEGFGTTKSMIFSPIDGTIELCWGGSEKNQWKVYDINKPLKNEQHNISISNEKMPKGLFDWQVL